MAHTQQIPLGFHSLAEIDDGRIERTLKMHLQRLAHDCMDRPGEKTSRKVQLTFEVKPVVNQEGDCDTCRVEIDCKSKVPTYRSKPYEMRVTKGGFLFNRDFPDSIGQEPLFGEED